ncbi:MAG: magnesium transporter [Gammaproteobacteria bacterium]|nr:magnesium transporter [Gammaproteobacteria bacterium]
MNSNHGQDVEKPAAQKVGVGERVQREPKIIDAQYESLAGEAEAANPAAASEPYRHEDSDSQETAASMAGSAVVVGDLLVEADGLAYPETTLAGALDFLVRRQSAEEITYIYVVDENRVLRGVVTPRDLLLGRPGQTLGEIMQRAPLSFRRDTPIAEAVQTVLHTHHRLYPVVDDIGRMVGMVYGWQLFDKVASEVSSQSVNMVGMDKEERFVTPILNAFRMRHPWLLVNLVTAFAAALVVGFFEDTISQIIVLAVFLPVLAGQSGNTGCQALAITLRGLTLGELKDFPVRQLYFKELALGTLNGLGVGIIAAAVMFIYATTSGEANPAGLAFVILAAMVGACMCSGFFGVAVPLTLRRFGADPAMASSIFLTTLTDIVGMGLMLFLATVLVL